MTRNPNPNHRKNILPGLQVPAGLPPEQDKFFQAVKEHLQVLQGILGQPKERAVTLADLERAGLANIVVKRGRGEIGDTAVKTGAARAAARRASSSTRIRDLSDIDVDGRLDGDLLQYRAAQGKWQRTTVASLTPQLDLFDDDNRGLVPASGGGDTNFLRADGEWAEPPGAGVVAGSLVYANTSIPAGNTVADTDSETAFNSAYTFTADSLEQGSVVRLRLAGVLSTDGEAPTTLRLRVKLGGDTILDTGILALAADLADLGWWADAVLIVQTAGETGDLEAQAALQLGGYIIPIDNASTFTIDTTGDLALTVTAEWGAADADDAVTLREMLVFVDNAEASESTLVFVNTSVPAGNTVEDDTDETAFSSSYTVPAKTLLEGSVTRLRMAGVLGTASAAGTDIRIRIKVGGSTVLDSGVLALAADLDDGWWADATMIVHAEGATGTLEAQGALQLGGYVIPLENESTFEIDTTADLEISITAEWADADADNTITLRELLVYLERAARPAATPNASYITKDDETATLPESVRLVAGAGIVLDGSTPNQLEVSSDIPDLSELTFITDTDESSDAPNSRQILEGANVELDDSVANELTVNVFPLHQKGAAWVRSGEAIETPVNDVGVPIHVNGTIIGATVTTRGGPGSCVIDIWKDAIGSYPPTVGDSITASAKPTISNGDTYTDTTLNEWTTSVQAGDVLMFHLESTSEFEFVSIVLDIRETE